MSELCLLSLQCLKWKEWKFGLFLFLIAFWSLWQRLKAQLSVNDLSIRPIVGHFEIFYWVAQLVIF